MTRVILLFFFFFFFNDTATTEIYTPLYTLSLHDALPICARSRQARRGPRSAARTPPAPWTEPRPAIPARSPGTGGRRGGIPMSLEEAWPRCPASLTRGGSSRSDAAPADAPAPP